MQTHAPVRCPTHSSIGVMLINRLKLGWSPHHVGFSWILDHWLFKPSINLLHPGITWQRIDFDYCPDGLSQEVYPLDSLFGLIWGDPSFLGCGDWKSLTSFGRESHRWKTHQFGFSICQCYEFWLFRCGFEEWYWELKTTAKLHLYK